MMFSRRDNLHYHQHSGTTEVRVTRGEQKTTINEYRAPTDDSIRLMNEMHEKAIANVLGRFDITNEFQCRAAVMRDMMMGGYRVAITYNLNSHKRTTSYTFEDRDFDFSIGSAGLKKVTEGIIKAISDDIAEFMSGTIFADVGAELNQLDARFRR